MKIKSIIMPFAALLLNLLSPLYAQDALVFSRIHSFGNPEQSGEFPYALIEGGDGVLYGTTFDGGTANDAGTVFRVNRDGTDYRVLHAFTYDGSDPRSLLQGSDGGLYGLTGWAWNNERAIFRIGADGAGFMTLHTFTGTVDGGYPVGFLHGADGALYGTISSSGNSFGSIFKLNADGSGFVILHRFAGDDGGADPAGGLVEGLDGVLYGTTSSGGTANQGIVFALNTDGTGFTILHNFVGGDLDGAQPDGPLLAGADGLLYGVTARGGNFTNGTIFKINRDGTGYGIAFHFPNDIFQSTRYVPRGGLLQATNGDFYGSLGPGGGGISSIGRIFRVGLDGTDYTLVDRDNMASALIQARDGRLYGTISFGNSRNEGQLFRMNMDGGERSTVHDFLRAGDPEAAIHPVVGLVELVGGQLLGASGGDDFGRGTAVYWLNRDGSGFQELNIFNNYAFGRSLNQLIRGADGGLYGTSTYAGDRGRGMILRLSVSAAGTPLGYSVLHTFESNGNGQWPNGSLVQGNDDTLYGTTSGGGSVVFKIQPDGTGYTVLHSFATEGIQRPYAGVILGTDGSLYGTATGEFKSLPSAVFKLNTDGTGYTVLHQFPPHGLDEFNPIPSLVQAVDGVLYGTTPFGGTENKGTVFRLNPDGTGFAILHNFTGGDSDGYRPRSSLIQAADGALYGTTSGGGSLNLGTVFRLNPDGANYQILHAFSGSDGQIPLEGNLVQTTDGALYGTTYGGGDLGLGTVFRLGAAVPPRITLHPADQCVTAGNDVFLTVQVSGTPPFQYQWRKGMHEIPGATNANLTFDNVQNDAEGGYSVVVSSPYGFIVSSTARLLVNVPPVADPSATGLTVVSPDGCSARVRLDGSRSNDADGDRLRFAWYQLPNAKPLATGIMAARRFPVGIHHFALAVSDGRDYHRVAFTVEVVSVSTAFQRLIASVVTSPVDRKRAAVLERHLRLAARSLDHKSPATTLNQLEAFEREVKHWVRSSNPELSADWLAMAQSITNAIKSPHHSGSKRSARHDSNTKPELKRMLR